MVLQGAAPKWAYGLMFLFQTLSSFKTEDKRVGKNWEKSLGRISVQEFPWAMHHLTTDVVS